MSYGQQMANYPQTPYAIADSPPPGSSTTTDGVPSLPHAPSTGNATASRGTTFSTTLTPGCPRRRFRRLYRENKLLLSFRKPSNLHVAAH